MECGGVGFKNGVLRGGIKECSVEGWKEWSVEGWD